MTAHRALGVAIFAVQELVAGFNERELSADALQTHARILRGLGRACEHLRRRCERELAAREQSPPSMEAEAP